MYFLKAISVKGTSCIKGCIKIQGSKNTVLPIMAATLLTSGVTRIYNCPMIDDVYVMCDLLSCLGVVTSLDEHVLTVDTSNVRYAELPYDLTGKLRSSILLLGPMLVRFHKACIGMPGGCDIGARPIDLHLEGMMKMNVGVLIHKKVLTCECFHLQCCEYELRVPSVGATENLIMTAVGAMGRTVLKGVAREPEIIELCNYLVGIGVVIDGIGTDTLIIRGKCTLQCCDYHNPYDRVVAGTYLLMAASLPSDLKLSGIHPVSYIANIIKTVKMLGASVVVMDDYMTIQSEGNVSGGDFATGCFPEFPTDLQSVLVACLTKAGGISTVSETIFEKRFSIVSELQKLNANIIQKGKMMVVHPSCMQGHTVKATDLRQGAALIVAGVLANGYTTVTDVSFVERGYENIVLDLKQIGVEIEYI